MGFFEDKKVVTERATLAEDIILPESINDYKNISAKFYIKILTPIVDKSKVSSVSKPAPNISKFNNNNLKPSEYQQVNYITLTIPKYMLFQFDNKINKGTEFIFTCIGEFKIEHFRLIGLYTLDNSEVQDESEKTTS